MTYIVKELEYEARNVPRQMMRDPETRGTYWLNLLSKYGPNPIKVVYTMTIIGKMIIIEFILYLSSSGTSS